MSKHEDIIDENRRLKIIKAVLFKALEAALAHELHGDGKCGCCWTLEARAAIDKARREE